MKQSFFFAIIFLCVIRTGNGQTTGSSSSLDPAFVSVMESNLKVLDTAQSLVTYQSLANSFERIGNASGKYWQPHYYASFCYAILAVKGEQSAIDAMTDKAQDFLDKANALHPNNSEISTLQALIINTKILADPMSRWRDYGIQSAEWLKKAREQDPANPRPWYIDARAKMRMPAMIGGGTDAARPLMDEAISRFQTFKPENSIAPNWGAAQAAKLAEQLKKG